jgi:hypothetical protein
MAPRLTGLVIEPSELGTVVVDGVLGVVGVAGEELSEEPPQETINDKAKNETINFFIFMFSLRLRMEKGHIIMVHI